MLVFIRGAGGGLHLVGGGSLRFRSYACRIIAVNVLILTLRYARYAKYACFHGRANDLFILSSICT